MTTHNESKSCHWSDKPTEKRELSSSCVVPMAFIMSPNIRWSVLYFFFHSPFLKIQNTLRLNLLGRFFPRYTQSPHPWSLFPLVKVKHEIFPLKRNVNPSFAATYSHSSPVKLLKQFRMSYHVSDCLLELLTVTFCDTGMFSLPDRWFCPRPVYAALIRQEKQEFISSKVEKQELWKTPKQKVKEGLLNRLATLRLQTTFRKPLCLKIISCIVKT